MKLSNFFKKLKEIFSLKDLTPEQIIEANKFREERRKRGELDGSYNPATGRPMCGGRDTGGSTYGSSSTYY